MFCCGLSGQDLMKPPIGYPRLSNSTASSPFGNLTDPSYDFPWFGNGDDGGVRRSELSESAIVARFSKSEKANNGFLFLKNSSDILL